MHFLSSPAAAPMSEKRRRRARKRSVWAVEQATVLPAGGKRQPNKIGFMGCRLNEGRAASHWGTGDWDSCTSRWLWLRCKVHFALIQFSLLWGCTYVHTHFCTLRRTGRTRLSPWSFGVFPLPIEDANKWDPPGLEDPVWLNQLW